MSATLCIYGEVLFDHFPDGHRVLGGAPFNVAWHLQAFGLDTRFISRVGDDDEGRQVRQAMTDWGMDTSGLQTDALLPTGRVRVSFDDDEPAYDIVAPCAYDRIETTAQLPQCSMLYHGSLALRDPVSHHAAVALLAQSPGVFVDVNLRPPWWQREQVLALIEHADWVKLNAHELELLAPSAALTDPAAFVDVYRLQGLILTRGAAGAELYTEGSEHYSVTPRGEIEIVDTVGAGDAFASVVLLGLARGWPMPQTLQRAQDFASAQVGQRGATVADPAYYRDFIDNWT